VEIDAHVIDLDAPLTASAGRPIRKRGAKATTLEAALTEKIQSSIKKCLADVASNLLIHDKKVNERWATLLQNQEEKMLIEKECIAVKKPKKISCY
jgi:hypothetical protein